MGESEIDALGKDFSKIQQIAGSISTGRDEGGTFYSGVLQVERLIGSTIRKTTGFRIDLTDRVIFKVVDHFDEEGETHVKTGPAKFTEKELVLISEAFSALPNESPFWIQEKTIIQDKIINNARLSLQQSKG